jgi:hypothetical protein
VSRTSRSPVCTGSFSRTATSETYPATRASVGTMWPSTCASSVLTCVSPQRQR